MKMRYDQLRALTVRDPVRESRTRYSYISLLTSATRRDVGLRPRPLARDKLPIETR